MLNMSAQDINPRANLVDHDDALKLTGARTMSVIFARPDTAGRSLALVLVAGAALSACASVQPKYAAWKPELGHGAQPSGAGGRYKVGDPYQVGAFGMSLRNSRTMTRRVSPPGTVMPLTTSPQPMAKSSI